MISRSGGACSAQKKIHIHTLRQGVILSYFEGEKDGFVSNPDCR
jgi:hypothetical protein